MKIFDVELNPADHKDNTPEQHEAIFAHLPYYDRKEAARQLQEALQPKSTTDPVKPEGEGIQLAKDSQQIKAVNVKKAG